jgi:hypothetical protein
MQERRGIRQVRIGAAWLAGGAFVVATLWDAGSFLTGGATTPSAGAAFSHTLIAAGIAAGCAATFIRVLQRSSTQPDAAAALRRITALELAAIGVMLAVLVVRGHREIPPDPPLIAAQLGALLALGLAERLRRRVRLSASLPRPAAGGGALQ